MVKSNLKSNQGLKKFVKSNLKSNQLHRIFIKSNLKSNHVVKTFVKSNHGQIKSCSFLVKSSNQIIKSSGLNTPMAHCAPHSPFVGEADIQKEVLGQCGLALVRKIPSTDLTYSADSKHVINL